jgi:localization factor PodJL
VPQPNPKSGANISTKPTQQTASRDSTRDAVAAVAAATDVTGSLPRPATPLGDKLPATIGGPVLRAAALSGDAAAAYEVGTRFSDGHGVPRSSEAAALWFERAAKQGLAPAQFRLGGFYEKGIGVKKDLAAARDLYLAAAGKGNGKAMHNLAVLYAEGVDGPADYANAAHWFREAADHGVTDSQYNLGILYARGTGVTQNYAESYKWFALAAIQGDQDAAKKSDEVAAHLDQQSLAAARLAVKTWTAQPQPDDAINVKTPPSGWDATTSAAPAAKPKPQPQAAKTPAQSAKIN